MSRRSAVTPLRKLLAECRRRGIELWPFGEMLRVEGPTSALTPAIVEALRVHKPAIMELLVAARRARYRTALLAAWEHDADTIPAAIRDTLDELADVLGAATAAEIRNTVEAESRPVSAGQDGHDA